MCGTLWFLTQLNLVGIPNQIMYSNIILNEMRGFFQQTDTGIFQRILDVNVFSDESI